MEVKIDAPRKTTKKMTDLYQFKEKVGSGAFAKVYRAIDKQT
jgi:serine/threonine protein kinase